MSPHSSKSKILPLGRPRGRNEQLLFGSETEPCLTDPRVRLGVEPVKAPKAQLVVGRVVRRREGLGRLPAFPRPLRRLRGGPGNAPLGAGGRNRPLGSVLLGSKSRSRRSGRGLGAVVVVFIGFLLRLASGHPKGERSRLPGDRGTAFLGGTRVRAGGTEKARSRARAAVCPGAPSGVDPCPTPDAGGVDRRERRSPESWPLCGRADVQRPEGSAGS